METKISSEEPEIIIKIKHNVTKQTEMFGCKNKKKHRSCKRKVKLCASTDDDYKTLLNTQKVAVKKQLITCIIDIESTEQIKSLRGTSTNGSVMKSIESNAHRAEVTEYKNNKKIKDCYFLNPSIKRVVPKCFRQTCTIFYHSLRSSHSRKEISKFTDRFEINAKRHGCAQLKRRHEHSNNRISFAERWESKLERQQRTKYKRSSSHLKKHYKDMLNCHNSLSPISLSTLQDGSGSTITYEDISSDNLSYSSEDLDTLIRRTKRRERKKVGRREPTLKQSDRQEQEIIQISSDEESEDLMTELSFCSELEASIHSRVTLRLAEVDEEAYSPTMHPSYINEYPSKMSPSFSNEAYFHTMNASPIILESAAHQNVHIQSFEEVCANLNKVEKKEEEFNIDTTITSENANSDKANHVTSANITIKQEEPSVTRGKKIDIVH